MARLYPSLIAADLLNLAHVITILEPYCDGFHIDIMDNHFVPNITFGADMTNLIAHASYKPCWVHLMIDNPFDFVQKLQLKNNSIVTFHVENCHDPKKIIDLIHNKGLLASIALKPTTPLDTLMTFISTIDHVLIMSVEPGFSGQSYIPAVEKKIADIATYIKNHQLTIRIGIDGSVNKQNIQKLMAKGVTDFAVASAIFNTNDYVDACKKLKEILR